MGYHFWGPNNKDYNILGSILGSPYFGKLPNHAVNCEREGFAAGQCVQLCRLLPDPKLAGPSTENPAVRMVFFELPLFGFHLSLGGYIGDGALKVADSQLSPDNTPPF